MKKIILILGLLISIHMETKSQQEKQFTAPAYFIVPVENNTFSKKLHLSADPDPVRDADFYFRRSKKQRTVGWITLGGGIVLSGVGLLLSNSNTYGTYDMNGNYHEDDNYTAGVVLTIAGGLSGIVSIPFMIMASGNKHKARLMLKNQSTGFGVPPNVNGNITGISMVLPLGK